MPTRVPDHARDPDSMTSAERRGEAAAILARGLVRAVRDLRARAAQSTGIQPIPGTKRLDSPADLRLSVAPRPRG